MPASRRLSAILAADVAGYSRLMAEDEAGTAQALREHRTAANPLVTQYGGRVVKTTGDGVLIEFGSVVGAVECALALQQLAAERNSEIAGDRRMDWRTGIHLGDVLVEGDDILGDGVNIAERLEGIAEPGGICISEDAFRQVSGKVATEFADIGKQALKNIARPARVYRGVSERRPGAQPPALPLPDKPSIAVLPFANLSGDPEQEYFTDGMVEEIITALSRIRWLFVIARNSSFTYKGQAVDVKQVGRELGVRYVLEGWVRKAGGRVRITAQLIDAANGTHLCADRFDDLLEDVFDLQEKVAINVAGIIEPALCAAEIQRSVNRKTGDLTAYDLYLRALQERFLWGRAGYSQALDLFGQAIERDPYHGPALSEAAFCHQALHVAGWTEDPETNRRQGIELAQRALGCGGDDAETLGRAAYLFAYFGEDIDVALTLIERSLGLTPSFARGWHWSGWLKLWAGQPETAIEHFERALRLNPRDPAPASLMGIGLGHYFTRRFEEARSMLLRSLREQPERVPPYRFLAFCYAHMRRLNEAREIVERLRDMTPVVVPSAGPQWRCPELRDLYLSGLRQAAGGET
jgi:adenylate cyclase